MISFPREPLFLVLQSYELSHLAKQIFQAGLERLVRAFETLQHKSTNQSNDLSVSVGKLRVLCSASKLFPIVNSECDQRVLLVESRGEPRVKTGVDLLERVLDDLRFLPFGKKQKTRTRLSLSLFCILDVCATALNHEVLEELIAPEQICFFRCGLNVHEQFALCSYDLLLKPALFLSEIP